MEISFPKIIRKIKWSKNMNTRTKALIAVILGNGIFGFSFLFSKVALAVTTPAIMLAIRFTTAFAVLNLLVLIGGIVKKKDGTKLIDFSLKGKPIRYVLLLAVFQPVIYFFAESNGIALTSSAFAGTIIAVIPIVGIVLDVIIMKVKVSKKQVVCAIASVGGVAITTLGAENMKSSFWGVVLLMIAVISGALFYVFSKKAGEYFNPLERTYVMFGVGSITYVILALLQNVGDYGNTIVPAVTNPTVWGCMIYLSVVSSVGAFMMLNFGSSYVTVSEASLFANLTTVISIIAGVVVLHETFTIQQVIGAAIIVASVYISSASQTEA